MKQKDIGKEFIDDLTGVYNRRYLREKRKELEAFRYKNLPFSLAIVDIDHFKEINDEHGHPKGDQVIKEFSQFLKSALRTTDVLIRYGGDEFISLLLNARRQDAEYIYSRILKQCRTRQFAALEITASAGVASYPEDANNLDDLLTLADKSLYEAKAAGRDRIGGQSKRSIEIPLVTFIDRKEEKEDLSKFLMECFDAPRVAMIKGNVGIGKTRIVREVLNSLDGREVLWSDCIAFLEQIPYYAVREIIKYKIARRGESILDNIPLAYKIEIAKLIPEILEGEKPKLEDLGFVLDKYRLYESVKKLIALGDKSKIIVLDNMQWVDQESAELMKYLLRSLRTQPIAFLLIYRQEEKSTILEDFSTYISRETSIKEIGLKAFKQNQIKMMLNALLGEEPKQDLLLYIQEESGGNPLYIEEIIKELNTAGYLHVRGKRWQFQQPDKQIIPKSIEDITERKYRLLSKEGQSILDIASVMGRFDMNIIKRISGFNEGHLIGILENIRKLGLLKERAGRMEFHEGISHNAIYRKKLGDLKRRLLHREVVNSLEQYYQGKEEFVIEELAFHSYQGNQADKGAQYCMRAGDVLRSKYANRDAIKYYTWACELLKEKESKENTELLIDCLERKSNVLCLVGENEAGMNALNEALQEAMSIKDVMRRAALILKKATIYLSTCQYDSALSQARECIRIYEKKHDLTGIANALNAIGNAYCYMAEYDKALKKYTEALTIARKLEDRFFQGKIANNIGNIYLRLTDYRKALKQYEYSLVIMGELGNKPSQIIPLNNIGIIYKNLGEYEKSLKYYEDSLTLATHIGNKFAISLLNFNIAPILCILGDSSAALQKYESALSGLRDTGNRDAEAGTLNRIGKIYLDRGNSERALKFYEEALEIAEQIKSRERTSETLLSIGELHLDLERAKKAKSYFEKAQTMAENSPEILKSVVVDLCDYYLHIGDLPHFEESIENLTSLPKQSRPKRFQATIDMLLSRYYMKLKDFDQAQEHLAKARMLFEELKEKANISRTYFYWGILLKAQNKEDESKRILLKALKIFEELGLQLWIRKTQNALSHQNNGVSIPST